jgi:hypothetical protein
MIKKLILVPVLLLLFLGGVIPAPAQVCPTVLTDVPVPIDIDGVTVVASHFYLNVPYGSCGLAFSDVKPKTTEAVVKAIARAFISGDFKAYQNTFSTQADTDEDYIKKVFAQQSAAYQMNPPDRVSQKYNLGALAYFVLGNANDPFLYSLVVVRGPDKSYYDGRSYMLNPAVENLGAAVSLLTDNFKTFEAPPAGNYYQVADVVPNDNGSVTCVFQGQILDMDMQQQPFLDYSGPYSGLMAFYQSSYMNLVNRTEEAYLESFSPASRKQEEAMIADTSFENFAYRNTLVTHKVGFILDADPVYYIFWHSADGDNFTYDTVLKTTNMANSSMELAQPNLAPRLAGSAQVKFQRVNIQHDTTLDHLLTDRTFVNNLQNLIEGSN